MSGYMSGQEAERLRLERRAALDRENRGRLRNTDFSLLASNCNGAFLLHDLGLRFRSPTVNLWLEPKDYLELLTHLEHYLTAELTFDPEEEARRHYPVGLLDGRVKICFQHYRTREAAREKWVERAGRVDLDNLFILFTDRDGCTDEDLCRFDALPYPNKVVFTHRPRPELKSAYYIKGFEEQGSVGLLFTFESPTSERKYYDQFPYVDWFNGDWPARP